MNSADSFSADYRQAREKFRAAVREAGGDSEAIGHPERGPDGGELSTDVAWIGPPNAERVLVTISATHGVEGFCGSGAQVDWLRRGEARRLPKGAAHLMVHAINPYGFAWLRRVTQENVDLNRNWVDFAAPLPANPGYDTLAETICPSDWDDETIRRTTAELGLYASQNGAMALQQAVSGGQYRHAEGVFFGGSSETWSRRVQAEILRTRLAGAGKVAIIDYHTGLGPWGYGEQIVTESPATGTYQRAACWYGGAIVSTQDGSSTSAEIAGDGLSAAPSLAPHAEVTGMALEVGTLSFAEVALALRADAWLHARGDPLSPRGSAIKSQVRAAFYGDAADWKGMVVGQSLLVCRQALRGLAS